MRRVRYQVACSLDNYIAGPHDEFDWITSEPSFDFEARYEQFDALLMGRRTYEIVRGTGESFRGEQVIVVSRSLRREDHLGVADAVARPGSKVTREDKESRQQEAGAGRKWALDTPTRLVMALT